MSLGAEILGNELNVENIKEYAEHKKKLFLFLKRNAAKTFRPKAEKDRSDKAKTMAKAFSKLSMLSMFNQSTLMALAELFSIVIDDEINLGSNSTVFRHAELHFVPCVHIVNVNSHNYGTDVFVPTDGASSEALRFGGSWGNSIDLRKSSLREPNVEEIFKYVDSLPLLVLQRHFPIAKIS